MSGELRQFCYTAGRRVVAGLTQELQIQPNIHYRPTGYNAARVLSLRLVGINPHYLAKIRTMRDPLTMWAGLDDKHRVRIGWDGQSVIIEIPKPASFWQQVTIEQLEQRHYLRRGIIATLGFGLQDEPRRINFQEATTAHVLITGLTRSGKTNTQRLIAWNLGRNSPPELVRLLILDVAKKGYRWADFGNITHLAHPIVTDIAEADRLLYWLVQEIERRGELGQVSPRLFVFIDELKALIDDSNIAAPYLARLAAAGAEFGLHLVLATQYPQIKMLGSAELKRNLSTRLCGKVDSADAASNALGLPDTGAESLQGYGDFLLRDFNGLARLTVAKLDSAHVGRLDRGEIGRLALPDVEDVYQEPRPRNQPDPFEPEQVALALFHPELGINKLAERLGIGNTKATRTRRFAEAIHARGLAQGFSQLELVAPDNEQAPPKEKIIRLWSGGSNGNGRRSGAGY